MRGGGGRRRGWDEVGRKEGGRSEEGGGRREEGGGRREGLRVEVG